MKPYLPSFFIYFEEGCYQKNKELVYLRDRNSLKLFCCIDRAITSIWFHDYCKDDWNKAYSEILRCSETHCLQQILMTTGLVLGYNYSSLSM